MLNKLCINNYELPIEVAISDDEKERGLMFQAAPVPNMVFPFAFAEYRRFWMKNTLASLDILFCRAGEVIQIAEGIPFSKESISSNMPIDLVIELNKGAAREFNIKEGNKFKIHYSLEKVAKIYKEFYLK